MHHAAQGHVCHHDQNEELPVKCCPNPATPQAYNWRTAPLERLLLALVTTVA